MESSIPKPLYHYTSQKGLIGILQTKKLWMTNIFYLNDSSEFLYTVDLVKTELENRKNSLVRKEGVVGLLLDEGINWKMFCHLELLESLLNGILGDDDSISENNIYVFSLSKECDNLNQWRGYCPKEGGFCIEFDTNKLLSLIDEKKEYEIKDCKYCKKNDSPKIKNLVDSCVEGLYNIKSKSGDGSVKVHREFLSEIIRKSPYIKNDSFLSESEFRIIHEGNSEDKIDYREGKSMIIPYIEFSLLDDNNKLPISEIWIGPTPHPELSKLSVESLLKSEKYEGVEVEISKIPYRSW